MFGGQTTCHNKTLDVGGCEMLPLHKRIDGIGEECHGIVRGVIVGFKVGDGHLAGSRVPPIAARDAW